MNRPPARLSPTPPWSRCPSAPRAIAHATGNLPDLIGPDAGVLVPPNAGPGGLLEEARDLLGGAVRYHRACGAAYCRSRNYRSADVAQTFIKAVL
jgi:hypothetical protein